MVLITVVVLSNNESDVPGVSRALEDILFDKPVLLPKKRTAIAVSEQILEACVGEYQGAQGKNIVTREGNQLFYRWTGGNITKIFPETETRFFFRNSEAQLDFIRDASGKVTKRIITIGGKPSEAVKTK